jgi:hypothetical protein
MAATTTPPASTPAVLREATLKYATGHGSGVWALLEHADMIDLHRTELLLKCPGHQHFGRFLVTHDGYIVDWLNLQATHMDPDFWEYLGTWVGELGLYEQ